LPRHQTVEVVVEVEPQHAGDQERRIRASRSATGA
jgi:hypothetical protein